MKAVQIYSILLLQFLLIVSIGELQGQELKVTTSMGMHLVVQDSLKLIFYNASFINHGDFSPGRSAVTFTSDTKGRYSYVGGSGVTSFYQLNIDRNANNFQLNQSIVVENSLNMLAGNLELNGYTVDLGSSGKIYGERSGSLITGNLGGEVIVTTDLHAPNGVNPGNIGIEITSGANYGKTTIIRGHKQQPSIATGSIHRYFEIRPASNSNIPMQARFLYHESELTGANESMLTLFLKENELDTWSNAGKDKTDLSAHWLMKTNLHPYGRFTLAVSPSGETDINLSANIYPNPTSRSVMISVTSEQEREIVITLLDMHGHILEVRNMNCSRGITKMAWDIERYPAGSYLFSFANMNLKNLKVERQ